MEKNFAKLFDFAGYQVLVTVDTDESNDKPKLTFRTHFSGLVLATSISFADSDAGEALRDKAFEKCDADMANGIRQKILAGLNLSEAA